AASSRAGWINHDRQTTASAPRKSDRRSSLVASRERHSRELAEVAGRRAIARTEVTSASPDSAQRMLVPMLPLAPTTTTRMSDAFPARDPGNDIEPRLPSDGLRAPPAGPNLALASATRGYGAGDVAEERGGRAPLVAG